MTFEELGVREDLLRGITDMGFETPMPVQEKVIPVLLNGDRDLVALAQTGTGKTAAFGLPVLQRVDPLRHVPRAPILAPHSRIVPPDSGRLGGFLQIYGRCDRAACIRRQQYRKPIRALKQGVQIIVATPGRLIDLINRGVVKLADVHTVVLDEADEMLNMGFVDSINDIPTHVPDDRKMLLFSATMPAEVAKIAKRFMHEPEEIVIGTRNEGAKNVRHVYYMVNAKDKYLALEAYRRQ